MSAVSESKQKIFLLLFSQCRFKRCALTFVRCLLLFFMWYLSFFSFSHGRVTACIRRISYCIPVVLTQGHTKHQVRLSIFQVEYIYIYIPPRREYCLHTYTAPAVSPHFGLFFFFFFSFSKKPEEVQFDRTIQTLVFFQPGTWLKGRKLRRKKEEDLLVF